MLSRQPAIRIWTGVIVGIALMVEPASAADFSALVWLDKNSDKIAFLTGAPAECIATPEDAEDAFNIGIGRTAFRSPNLLGGEAAKAGISCNTCHRNGQDNPHFFLPGLSDTPGRVDVTAGFFNSSRDDRIANPVPIPTLLDVGEKAVLGTVVRSDRLDKHLDDIITTEFEGKAPPKAISKGMLAYLGALRSNACAPGQVDAQNLGNDWREVISIYRLVVQAVTKGEADTAKFLLLALRHRLGVIAQSFHAVYADHTRLVVLSRDLAELEVKLPTGAIMRELAAIRVRLDQTGQALRAAIDRSLYNRQLLIAYISKMYP